MAELPALRSPMPVPLRGPVARRDGGGGGPFRPAFITPDGGGCGGRGRSGAGGAGRPGGSRRAYVNNGGDIALWLAPGQSLTGAHRGAGGAGPRDDPRHATRCAGIATSGWRGRSLSLGIADAVTVLARTAAMADAAATMIANAVDLPDHPGISRRPARECRPTAIWATGWSPWRSAASAGDESPRRLRPGLRRGGGVPGARAD